MEDIAEVIRRLEEHKGITPEQLRENPAFIDAVLSATNAAIRTSQEEKRKALRNAVLNSALPDAPDIAIQQTFIATVASVTSRSSERLPASAGHPKNAARGPSAAVV